jgi:hypothetical protein
MQRWNIKMAKGKDMKQAEVFTINFDQERKFTFDFNALMELGEFYEDPYSALDLLEKMNPKALRAVIYSMLVAGAKVKDEDAELDLSVSEVGHLVGGLFRDKENMGDIMKKAMKGIGEFFRDPADEQKADEKKSTADALEAEKN